MSLYSLVRYVMDCQHWYFYVRNLSSVCLFIFQSEEDISVKQAQSHWYVSLVSIILIVPCQYSSTFIYFWQLFILFLGLTYWSSASASSCLLHVFCFAETQYQTEFKRDKNRRRFFWNIYDFWEVKSTRNGVRGGHEVGGAPYPPGAPLTLVVHP